MHGPLRRLDEQLLSQTDWKPSSICSDWDDLAKHFFNSHRPFDFDHHWGIWGQRKQKNWYQVVSSFWQSVLGKNITLQNCNDYIDDSVVVFQLQCSVRALFHESLCVTYWDLCCCMRGTFMNAHPEVFCLSSEPDVSYWRMGGEWKKDLQWNNEVCCIILLLLLHALPFQCSL